MDKKIIQNLSVSTLVEIVEDLSFDLILMKDEVERLKHSGASNIEQLQTEHTYEIEKLHKEYGETIVQLRDELVEKEEDYAEELEVVVDKQESAVHNAKLDLCKEFEAQIVNTMTIALENSDYNVESREYKALLYLVEIMDTQLISMNVTNNFQGRVLHAIKEILSVSPSAGNQK